MKRGVASAIVLFLFLSSSAFAGSLWRDTTPDNTKERLFSIFSDIESTGPTEGNVKKLEDFVRDLPSSPVTDEAISRLASIYIEKKRFKEAGALYQRLLENFPLSPYKAESLWGLGYSRYRMGDTAGARKTLKEVLSNPSSLTLMVKAKGLLSAIEGIENPSKAQRKMLIGAVLPLKGDYSAFGENTLKGILLAAGVFAGGAQSSVEVMVKDSGETEESVEKAMEELKDEGVIGVIGPLLSSTALPAAHFAQKRGLPAILLSQKEGVPESGDYVFRNFLTPKGQAQKVASYATRTLGLRRFAVLRPENPYGEELSRHFKEAVKKNGGLIVGEVSYPADKRDFAAELKSLFSVKVKEELKGRRRITEYTPAAKIEALYIPDYHTTVAQIAPHLAYYNIKGVQLLGGNGWNSKELLKLAGEYVEGAVFVDGFFPESKRKASAEFVEGFKRAFGYTPGILEAEGHDSAMIMLSSLRTGASDRKALKEEIAKAAIEGATGAIRFDTSGEAIKELFILRVKKGNIVEVPGPKGPGGR